MRAYVIGNAAIDESFAVACLPQTGESIKASMVNRCLGGKGANQAIMLSRCGIDTTLITATANDPRGQNIQQLLSHESLTTQYINTSGQHSDQSILLTRPDGENTVITTTACAEQIDLATVKPLLTTIQTEDNLILQGNLGYQATHDLLAFGKDSGMRTIFNPSPVQREFIHLWPLVDVLFLNASEAASLTGKADRDAAQYLLDQGVKQVVLTLGRSGAWLATNTQTGFIPANAVAAVDTTGAGDTFMSVAIGSATLRSIQIDRLAMQHAHQAAAITISRHGTVSAFPTSTELGALLATVTG